MKLSSSFGTTEVGTPTASFYENRDRSFEDWQYIRFSELVNVRFVPQPDGVTFESEFLVRNLDPFMLVNPHIYPYHRTRTPTKSVYTICRM